MAKFGTLFTAELQPLLPLFPSFTITIAFCTLVPVPYRSLRQPSVDSSHFPQQNTRMAAVVPATSSVNKTRHCLVCEKTAPEVKLFWCARCQQVSYCVRPPSPTSLTPSLTPGSPPVSQSKECQTSNWKSHKTFCKSQAEVQNSLQHLANAAPGTAERETYEVEVRLKRWIEVLTFLRLQTLPASRD